jgi:glutamate racemase
MSTPQPLAFIDSGVGGIPYLAHLRTRLPGVPLVYVADNRNFPYGKKSEAEVVEAVLAMARRVIGRYRPELVVVACNTASLLALEALRSNFDTDFVGVVPAVKPAAERSAARRIGVMATERAVKSAYLDRLVDDFASDCRVTRVAATELIRAIEADPFMDCQADYERLLEDIRRRFQSDGVDTIVLGCTHFLMLKPELLAPFHAEFAILDSREGVTRRTLTLLERHGTLAAYQARAAGQATTSVFHLTGDQEGPSVYRRVAEAYGLAYGGTL